jgi:hypothetical protein
MDTTGWIEAPFVGMSLALRLPPSFRRDEDHWYVEGGQVWVDGQRKVEIVWEPHPGLLDPVPWKGYSSACVDTIAGLPFRITSMRGRTQYIFNACSTVPDPRFGYYDLIRAFSPDSSDQDFFRFVVRTVHATR